MTVLHSKPFSKGTVINSNFLAENFYWGQSKKNGKIRQQAPVVPKLDNAIQWKEQYTLLSLICWKEIYLQLDSVICLLYNWAQDDKKYSHVKKGF